MLHYSVYYRILLFDFFYYGLLLVGVFGIHYERLWSYYVSYVFGILCERLVSYCVPYGYILGDTYATCDYIFLKACSNDSDDNDDVALVQTGVDDGADEAVDDTSSLMQRSAAEEERLHEAGVSDAVRRLLRDLLRSLENTQARDEGAEYRWGVQCSPRSVPTTFGMNFVLELVDLVLVQGMNVLTLVDLVLQQGMDADVLRLVTFYLGEVDRVLVLALAVWQGVIMLLVFLLLPGRTLHSLALVVLLAVLPLACLSLTIWWLRWLLGRWWDVMNLLAPSLLKLVALECLYMVTLLNMDLAFIFLLLLLLECQRLRL
eukprot:s5064_g4.t1